MAANVSRAVRNDLLKRIRAYNPRMKEADLDWLLEHQGVEAVEQAIRVSTSGKQAGRPGAKEVSEHIRHPFWMTEIHRSEVRE